MASECSCAYRAYALFLFLILFHVQAFGSPEEGEPGSLGKPYIIPRTESSVRIDGVLDDAAWKTARVVELNYEISPRENVPPQVKTEVLFIYDNSNLYVGFRCYDPDPSQIRAYLRDRDAIGADDWVAVELDTYNDQRRAFTLLVTPLGVQADGISDAAGIKDYNWDMIFSTAGKITPWGYGVEMAIPFSSLRFQRSDEAQIWGINAARGYIRDLRHQIWLAPYDRSNSCRVCQYLKFKGFEGVSPGRNVEITPTLTAVQTVSRDDFPSGELKTREGSADVGLTVRWGMTPNLFLGGTLNPDFSQVEADSLQLDINEPFALQYPEKRPFFTDGLDFFKSGINVIYTRTMRNPELGIKLSGKEGANAVGAYLVQDNVTNLIFPGSQYSQTVSLPESNMSSVFRYTRDIWNNSNVGVLLTDREGDDYFNRVFGIDSTLRLTRQDTLQLQFLGSNTRYDDRTASVFGQPVGSFSDRAVKADYVHKTRHYTGEAGFSSIGPDFRADLGFLPQVGYDRYYIKNSYEWRNAEDSWWSSTRLANNLYYSENNNGVLLEKGAATSFSYQGISQTTLSLENITSRRVYNGVEFGLSQFSVNTSIMPTSNVSLYLDTTFGDHIDFANTRKGRRIRLSPFLDLQLGLHLGMYFFHVFERMNVNDRRLYTANVSQLSAVYQFNRRTFFRSILQYIDYDYNVSNYIFAMDPHYRELFTQLLFSYKLNPRTVLFLGYSDNCFGSGQYGITRKDYTLFAKIGYAWVL